MSQQFQQPQFQQTQQHFAQQQYQQPHHSASQLLQRGSATASLYGPPLSRTRPSDGAAIAAAQAAYDAELAQRDAEANEQARANAEAQWNSSGQRGNNRTAFYNTRPGDALISQARQDLSAHAHPAASSVGCAHLSGVHDNRQRAFHCDCVLPNDIATGVPDQRNGAKFQQYVSHITYANVSVLFI